MTITTSLKLPDALKASIAKVAALEGKTAHALMVDTLQVAMEDALARQQFYADGEASHQESVRTNQVFRGADVKAYVMARVQARVQTPIASATPDRPQAEALDAAKPFTPPENPGL
jgi:hypothetical protein